ncbi:MULTISPECIES: hypothetical protein [Saccharibacillus]|uniref:hypothetical protein n=1 Tax=Saccharibacillus TaxID=456492 RepID=UPI00123C22D1|nr:hypothetical protein [Saccharibacillus sp. WB 17]MWJ30104.1 hypothetical protein [Saccharibacillus sp. WB 17]
MYSHEIESIKQHYTEQELVEKIELIMREALDNSTVILREVDCWQGRADLVKANLKSDYENLDMHQIELLKHYTCSNIISLLHKKAPRTEEYLQKALGLSSRTLKKWLISLEKNQIACKNSYGSYLISDEFSLPNAELYAYEVKLHNWKRALYQANQYKGFSNFSFVVMPKKNINAALANIEAFYANNIGLIQIDELGLEEILFKPKKIQPRKKSYNLIGIALAIEEKRRSAVKH